MKPGIAAWAKKAAEDDTGWPVEKMKKAKRLAESMKGKDEIDDPHALSRWMVARKKAKAKKEG